MNNHSMLSKITAHIILAFVAVTVLIPMTYVLLVSFGKHVTSGSAIIPDSYTLENYRKLFIETQFLRWITNSLIMSVTAMALGTLVCTIAAYVFGRVNFAGKRMLRNFILLIQVFPLTLSMVSINKIFQTLDLANRIMGLSLINAAMSAAGLIFVAIGYVNNVPYTLEEAAMMDGASGTQRFFKISLPLLRPMFSFVCIQSFVLAYNEYVIANVVMTKGFESMPLAVGLQSLIAGQYGTNWSIYCAGAILGSLPVLLLFYYLQRNYISNSISGGIKE